MKRVVNVPVYVCVHASVYITYEIAEIETLTVAQSEYDCVCTTVIDVKMLASNSEENSKASSVCCWQMFSTTKDKTEILKVCLRIIPKPPSVLDE